MLNKKISLSLLVCFVSLSLMCGCDGRWTGAKNIGEGSTLSPSISMNPDGKAMLIYGENFTNYAWMKLYNTKSGWSSPILLDMDGRWVINHKIDLNGNALALTSSYDDTLWAHYYTPATGWGSAEFIAQLDNQLLVNPRIVFNDSREALVIWAEWGNLYSKKFVPGQGWSPVETICSGNFGNHINLASNRYGDCVIFWSEYDSGHGFIKAINYSKYYGWGNTATISEAEGYAQYPDAAMGSFNNAIIAWLQDNDIYASYCNYGNWESPKLIEVSDAYANNPHVSIDDAGNSFVVWSQGGKIWLNKRVESQGWDSPIQIGSPNVSPLNDPVIAMNASGNCIVAWINDWSQVWATVYTVNKGWQTPQKIGENKTIQWTEPILTIDNKGNAFALWEADDEDAIHSYINRYERLLLN